jgi:signal-transduction protein with cAMP-binding, CBS, and nucleotidyltransferase domain
VTLVKEIMTAEVVSVPGSASVSEVAKRMADEKVGTVAVIDNDHKLEGFVTDRKIATEVVAKGKDPKTTKVKEIMTSSVFTSKPDVVVCEAVGDMHDKNVRRVPIVNDDLTLVGILSTSDVAKEHAAECDNCGRAILEISSHYA